ncbi:hypothetical protein A3J17_00160 [Candidatus Curtissbacteria bacterium RIFCSPLOWO2_02_FULL_40_11]|nr:MAG: hypothetical protein A3J17_00160 [Candidatus Curtissbacteria bacterium RIFCSPLOWO2_02_FULL_40_11]
MRKTKIRLPWLGESIGRDTGKKRWIREGEFEEHRFSGSLIQRVSVNRLYIFYITAFLILLVFLARLFQLTIISGRENQELAESNRIQLIEREAERGVIYDREGKILTRSNRIYLLFKNGEEKEITKDQAQDLEREGLASENFEGELGRVKQEVRREYTLREAAAHVLGYTSEIQEKDLRVNANLSSAQSIGRLGLEQTYNNFLTGRVGKKLIEVDTFGKKISILGEEESNPGQDLYTTLDGDLQRVVFESLHNQAKSVGTKKGAVVVQNPNTGEVLALASSPSFDPEDIGKSVSDLEKPFFNRATQGSYPPGSVFKIVTALAGLESELIDENTEIEDVGQFELGGSTFSNWYFNQYGKKDGILKIQKAIARSNDIFFYRVAEKIGLRALREMAKELGLGQKTGIDLPSEAVGLVPDEVWKQSAFSDNWYLGDTMHLGIGQGFMLTTPIQMNVVTSFVASGKLTRPYLVSKIASRDEDFVEIGGKILGDSIVASHNLEFVKAGMRDACKLGGTGAPFFSANYDVGCKTGTAERELGNPHAWFTVFAPFDFPQIAVTVLVEDGGEGSSVAAPVAKEIVDWWMENRI